MKRSATFTSSLCALSIFAVLFSQASYSSMPLLKASTAFLAANMSSFDAEAPSGIDEGALGLSHSENSLAVEVLAPGP